MQMKSVLTISVLVFLFLVVDNQVYSQDNMNVRTICGEDTFKIFLDNFKYGIVDWQESEDGINWLDIKDKHDTVLVCFTTEEKYIRGCVTTSDCEQIFSNPVFIRQKPVAFAGLDKEIMTNGIYLKGNAVDGSTGKWEIISGAGNTIVMTDSCSAFLSGSKGSVSQVTWTLINDVCASSTDTIEVSFVENEYNPHWLLVDETDSIIYSLSDINSGVYYIRFSSSDIEVSDSTILIGYAGDGFLRRVDNYDIINDSTFKFYTSDGEIEDLLIEGVLNTGDDVDNQDASLKSAGAPRILNHLPSREELKTDAKYKDGLFVYYYPDENTGSKWIKSYSTLQGGGININLDCEAEVEINENSNLTIGLNGNMGFEPNFIFDYGIRCGFPHHWWKFECGLNYLKAGMENAALNYGVGLSIKGDVSVGDTVYNRKKKVNLYKKKSKKVILAGGVPVVVVNSVTFDFSIIPKLEASIEAGYSWEKLSVFSAYLYKNRGKPLRVICEKENSITTSEYSVEINGNAGVDFILSANVDMKLYGFIGPYLKIPVKVGPEICANSKKILAEEDNELLFAWGFNVPLSIDAIIGCKMKLFRKMLFNASVSTNLYETGFYLPYNIDLISGNHQSAIPGEKLESPLKLQLKNSKGGKTWNVPVYFRVVTGDGELSERLVYSDWDGYVENYLTLGDSSYNRVKVDVFKCDFSQLEGSDDMFLEVNSKCKNSSLQLTFNFEDKTVMPVGVMGVQPYSYSLDGADFSEDTIRISIYDEEVKGKQFYVMDNDGCVVSNTLEFIDTCAYSNLAVSFDLEGTNGVASGFSGVGSYLFSLDSENLFSSENRYTYISPGDHRVFVKDSLGCANSLSFSVNVETSDSLVAFYPFNGNASDESGNMHDGNVGGAVLCDDRFGKENSAFIVNSDNIITIPSVNDFTMIGDFSINMWAAIRDSEGLEENALLSIGIKGVDKGLHLIFHSECDMVLFDADNNFGICASASVFYDEVPEWHQFTIIRKTDTITLYVDGDKRRTFYQPGELFSSCDFYFGNTSDKQHSLNGIVDDIRIYNRMLFPSEINALYHENGWNDGLLTDPFIDPRDSTVYRQVRIGNQVWMTENLKWLPEVYDPPVNYPEGVVGYSKPLYFVYDYNDTIVSEAKESRCYDVYGVLYNYSAAMSACPDGWRLPERDDWLQLAKYINVEDIEYSEIITFYSKSAGLHLKAYQGWDFMGNNGNGIDDYFFSALPGGGYVNAEESDGYFGVEQNSFWWFRKNGERYGVLRLNDFDNYFREEVIQEYMEPYHDAYSVRCVKED